MPDYFRAYVDRQHPSERAADGAPDSGPIRFIASTENIARDGMIIKADGWQLDNYRKNPVVLWAHGYGSMPIGRADVEIEDNRLLAIVTFDQEDDFARQVESKYRRGFLNAVSVSWETKAIEKAANPDVRAIVTEAELFDISAVPVPADPDALKQHQLRGLADLGDSLMRLLEPPTERKAIPPHSTAKAPEDAPWDGPGEVAKAEGAAQLRRMHAWVNDEMDADMKQAYKLPHHKAEDGQVVWRGVAAAMARLLQASTQIPDADQRGTYAHLARHYEQFDREPPGFRTNAELAALGPEEIHGLFLEGEPELLPDLFPERAEDGSVAELIQVVRELTTAIRGPQRQSDPSDEGIAVLSDIRDLLSKVKLPED